MGIPWAASGPASAASMPVSEKSSGPCTLRATQSFSHCTAVGTEELAQTMDSSSVVQVNERNDLSCHTHCGISCSGDRRTIAILSGSMDRFMVKYLTGGGRPARWSSACALTDQGISSQSRQNQSVWNSVQKFAFSRAACTRASISDPSAASSKKCLPVRV